MVGSPEWYDRPATLVEEQVDKMWGYAGDSLSTAKSMLGSLGSFQLDSAPAAPVFTGVDTGLDLGASPTAPTAPTITGLSSFVTPVFDDPSEYLTGLDDGGDPPVFTPSIAGLNIPTAPTAIDTGGLPDKPIINDVSLPVSPDIALPSLPSLTDLVIPTFTFPDLPVFDATAPSFEGSAPSAVINWSEPTYSSENIAELTEKVRWMLQGGTGIPDVVEAALFDKAASREDIVSLKATQEAFENYAARGFDMPAGMLVEQVNAITEKAILQKNTLSREIMIKSAEWEIENLRFAVQQGIALEGLLINIFNNAAQRAFEAAKYQVESALALYNAQVALFNARQSAFSVAATVYESKLKAALSILEVFKAQIEGQKAIGEVNEQKLKAYSAGVEALTTHVEIYKAQMEGAKIESEISSSKIDMYKADIQAYAEKLSAGKTAFDAYKTQVEAEAAKAGILEAESRAYAASIQGFESKNNVKIQKIRAKVEAVSAMVGKFSALTNAEKAKIDAQVSAIQANTSLFSADVSRFAAQAQSETARTELAQKVIEARLRNNIAIFEVKIKEYDANMTRIIEIARLKNEAMKGAAQVASQIASGAMAGMHVSASLSGSGSLSGSDSLSHNFNYDV